MLCKGADDVIYDRLALDDDNQLFKNTKTQVNTYAKMGTKMIYYNFKSIGLRTLCFAEKKLDPNEYHSWAEQFQSASSSIKNRKEKVEKVAELIEKDLYLIGATAIEDKLQEAVPETLQDILRADIKLWILTGDKQETAISIGKSCGILTEKTELIFINAYKQNEVATLLTDSFDKLDQVTVRHTLFLNFIFKGPCALIIDGKSLVFALEERAVNFLILNFHLNILEVFTVRISMFYCYLLPCFSSTKSCFSLNKINILTVS